MHEFDIVTDAYAALKLLSTSTRIDPRRIGLMGFSYGGMAARFAIDERFREALVPELPGFALYADFYGPCFQKLDTTRARAVPLLTLRGTDDASNDLAACAARERELAALAVALAGCAVPEPVKAPEPARATASAAAPANGPVSRAQIHNFSSN